MENVFFHKNFLKIGGIETFFYYLAQKYKDKDITIYYITGDVEQIKRIAKYVRIIKWTGERIKCKRLFITYQHDILPYVDFEELYFVAHADYKYQGIAPFVDDRVTKYFGVSKAVADTYAEISGKKVDVCYNPLVIGEKKKVLHLISATRLSREKGGERIETLANLLDERGIPFTWEIYTDDVKKMKSPNIVFRKPNLNIQPFISDADYLVQLSDTEGYCYAVWESLAMGTPVIVTDLPVFKEMGVVNGKNGFILNKDMTDIDIDSIYNGLEPFTYKPKQDKWAKMLGTAKTTYSIDLSTNERVRCIMAYYDLEFDRLVKNGEIFVVNKPRADLLKSKKLIEVL